MDAVTRARERGFVVLRVVLGFGFLFAGLEKLFDFHGTGPFSAAGFLARATAGSVPNMVGHDVATMVHNPTRQLWVDLAGNATAVGIINVLVVSGEIAIGAALILGVATRLAGALGTLMMFLFWIANWSFSTGIINEQFVYGLLAAVVAYGAAGRTLGLDAVLERSELARRTPVLRYVLG
jgi:thiosulfate dehydrogenase [quinone] large subunit